LQSHEELKFVINTQRIYFAGEFFANLNIHMPQEICYGKVISIFLAKSIYAMNLLRWQICCKVTNKFADCAKQLANLKKI
jgi:hypothetical protein